ncbi:Jasmonate-induced protein-like protein [Bienertia sinuspersici]
MAWTLSNGSISEKEKATIQKAIKEAQNIIPKERELVTVPGQFMSNPTERIGGGADGTFVHEGANSQGQLPVVVYVETGNPGKFEEMGWNVIEANLDKSGNTSSYKDDETGATAAAEIEDFGDKAALIGATFYRIIA